MNLGSALNKIRLSTGKTQSVVSEESGITKSVISELENNIRKPRLETIIKICEALDVPLVALFWVALEVDDIPLVRREHFNIIKPSYDKMIVDFFLSDKPRYNDEILD